MKKIILLVLALLPSLSNAQAKESLNLVCKQKNYFEIKIQAQLGQNQQVPTNIVISFLGTTSIGEGLLQAQDLNIETSMDTVVSAPVLLQRPLYTQPGVYTDKGVLQIINNGGQITAVLAMTGLTFSAPCN